MKNGSNQFGFITLRKLGIIMFFGATIYYGGWAAKFYYDFYAIKSMSRDLLREAHIYSVNSIKNRISNKIDELGTPIYEEDFILKKSPEKIIINIRYSEFLYFQEYALLEIPFEVDEVRYFR